MHELSLVKSIVDTCQKIVQEKDAHRVKLINLQVGTLSGVDIDALNFAWDAGVKDTVLEKATYNLEIKNAIAVCSQCQTHYQTNFLYDPCPKCGNFGCTYLCGRDFKISSVTII